MNIHKFILWGAAVAVIWSFGWLGVEALSINTSSFSRWIPVFKEIFLKASGVESNPAGVIVNGQWIYTAQSAVNQATADSNVLKKEWVSRNVRAREVVNNDIAVDSITNTHIINNSITNNNFADTTITNNKIVTSTLGTTKFDPSIVWPSWANLYVTNNICPGTWATYRLSWWTVYCDYLPVWPTGWVMPTCAEWEMPVFWPTWRGCEWFLLSTTWGNDANWSWTYTSNIRNKNIGNVWIWITTPNRKLTVSGSLNILQETEDETYCYATDQWVPVSSFNAIACAGCEAWYSLNTVSGKCEATSCVGCGWADGWTYANTWTMIAAWLCAAWSSTGFVLSGTNTYVWNCVGNTTWAVSCEAEIGTGEAGTCGSIQNTVTATAPSTNLCATGTPSAVTERPNRFTWTCTWTSNVSCQTYKPMSCNPWVACASGADCGGGSCVAAWWSSQTWQATAYREIWITHNWWPDPVIPWGTWNLRPLGYSNSQVTSTQAMTYYNGWWPFTMATWTSFNVFDAYRANSNPGWVLRLSGSISPDPLNTSYTYTSRIPVSCVTIGVTETRAATYTVSAARVMWWAPQTTRYELDFTCSSTSPSSCSCSSAPTPWVCGNKDWNASASLNSASQWLCAYGTVASFTTNTWVGWTWNCNGINGSAVNESCSATQWPGLCPTVDDMDISWTATWNNYMVFLRPTTDYVDLQWQAVFSWGSWTAWNGWWTGTFNHPNAWVNWGDPNRENAFEIRATWCPDIRKVVP